MTGKEYLIDYMQNHNSEEIYDLIKNIEKLTFSYTDSRQAFINFLDNYDSLAIYPSLEDMVFVKSVNGEWILTQEDK